MVQEYVFRQIVTDDPVIHCVVATGDPEVVPATLFDGETWQ